MLGSIGFGVVFFTILFFYTRLKLAAISAKKQYASVQVRMMAPPATTQSEYLENMSHLVHYLNRLFRALKSLLCKKKKPASVAEGGYNKTKVVYVVGVFYVPLRWIPLLLLFAVLNNCLEEGIRLKGPIFLHHLYQSSGNFNQQM